jgi:hypothetical protein
MAIRAAGLESNRGRFGTGLPDGLFSNPKNQIWVNFGGSCNGRRWYILRTHIYISYILWTFSIVRGNLAYISCFGTLYQEKSGNLARTMFILAVSSQRVALAKEPAPH